jgi:hypothetical protein
VVTVASQTVGLVSMNYLVCVIHWLLTIYFLLIFSLIFTWIFYTFLISMILFSFVSFLFSAAALSLYGLFH